MSIRNSTIDKNSRGLVVSTLEEAEFYAKHGFDDILYGYPLLEHHMERNYSLTELLHSYHVMINNFDSVCLLTKYEPPCGKKWSVYLSINAGDPREGVPSENSEQILQIGKFLLENNQKIEFQGTINFTCFLDISPFVTYENSVQILQIVKFSL